MSALATTDPGICPDCSRPLRREQLDQGALFIDCGYGATQRTIVRYCPCGWTLDHITTEVRP